MFARSSSGSRPLNIEASAFHRAPEIPPVTTPNVMCVASSQWWEIGARGFGIAEMRCG